MASHPVAYYGPTGSVVSAIDTYYVKTLCVQEIISGEYVLLVFFLVYSRVPVKLRSVKLHFL